MPENRSLPIAIIVAMAQNQVIGRDNQLPWHLPGDLKYFKANTVGKPIIMGRKTFESIGKPLPGRANIVVTRDRKFSAEGVRVVHSIEQAVQIGEHIAQADNAAELMVIGGAELYRDILPRASRLYITRVHADVPGDAYFPSLDWSQWTEQSCEDIAAGSASSYAYSFTIFQRF